MVIGDRTDSDSLRTANRGACCCCNAARDENISPADLGSSRVMLHELPSIYSLGVVELWGMPPSLV